MQIPDGEYEIDLLVFASPNPEPSLALRYGFVPDSMDQHGSLTLYKDDLVCILEAPLIDRLSRPGARLSPIIFEGISQQRRPLPSGSAQSGPGPDSYFLSFKPSKSSSNGFDVLLQHLSSTIRMSKTRNAEKWRSAIAEWEKPTHVDPPAQPQKPQRKPSPKRQPSPLRKKPQKDVSSQGRQPSPKKDEPSRNRLPPPKKEARRKPPKQPASKRPPTATPEPKDIISMSDFEDIDSDAEESNSAVNADSQKVDKVADEKPKPKSLPPKTAKAPDEQKPEAPDDGDDFQDLEDQLQEALEENPKPNQAPVFNADSESDSDEDEDTRGPRREAIVINMDDGDDDKSKHQSAPSASDTGKKPMSLRELYGNGRNDDSSSEEE